MTESKESKKAEWQKAVGTHWGIVIASFFPTMSIIRATTQFDPEGALGLAGGIASLFGLTLAGIVGLLFSRATKLSCMIVIGIAFLFPCLSAIGAYEREKDHQFNRKHVYPYDHFRDHIVSPIPKSVSNLRFPSEEEDVLQGVHLEFDIDPKDMDSILYKMNLARKDPDKLLNPKDAFQFEYYMPIPGDYHIYQTMYYNDEEYNSIYTIKLNAKHDHAFFRYESPLDYRQRSWEKPSDILNKMRDEALQKLKLRYEKAHVKAAK